MSSRYNLFRMFREIAEDETIQKVTNVRLSQAEINRLVKARKRPVPPPPLEPLTTREAP
jgi:hypothetical protein